MSYLCFILEDIIQRILEARKSQKDTYPTDLQDDQVMLQEKIDHLIKTLIKTINNYLPISLLKEKRKYRRKYLSPVGHRNHGDGDYLLNTFMALQQAQEQDKPIRINSVFKTPRHHNILAFSPQISNRLKEYNGDNRHDISSRYRKHRIPKPQKPPRLGGRLSIPT